jgi:hypothetical protein
MTQTKVEAPFVENNNPFRNLIINGDMQIAQRSTSTTGVANNSDEGYNSLDRFALQYYGNEGGAATMSQDTTVPSDTSFGVRKKSLKVDVTTADTSIGATGIITLEYIIEASDVHHSGWDYTSSSSNATLSFWARSVKAGVYGVNFKCYDASGGEQRFCKTYTLVANTWQHVVMTVPGDSTLVFNDDNGQGLGIRWILAAGDDRNDATAGSWYAAGSAFENTTSSQVNFYDSTDNNFFLTGVQFEVGDSASVFEALPHAVQLQRCQRYFQLFNDGSYDNEGLFTGTLYTNIAAYGYIYLQTPMRAGPSLYEVTGTDYWVAYTNNSNNTFDDMGINGDASNTFVMEVYVPSSGNMSIGSGGQSCFIRTHNTAARLGADAEL